MVQLNIDCPNIIRLVNNEEEYLKTVMKPNFINISIINITVQTEARSH